MGAGGFSGGAGTADGIVAAGDRTGGVNEGGAADDGTAGAIGRAGTVEATVGALDERAVVFAGVPTVFNGGATAFRTGVDVAGAK